MRGPFRGLDHRLLAIVVMSALVHITALLWIERQPPRQMDTFSYEALNRYVTFPKPEVEVEEVAVEDGAGEAVDESAEPEEHGVASKEPDVEDAGDSPEDEEGGELSMVDEVQKGTILEAFGRPGEEGSVMSSMLDHADSGELALAFSESSKIAHGSASSTIRPQGGGGNAGHAGTAVGGVNLPGGGNAANTRVDTGRREETRVKSLFQIPEREIARPSGPVDMRAILAVLRRHQAAIQHCYDRHLTRFPESQGRLLVAFTVGQNGRVSNVNIESDGVGGQVGQCVSRIIRRIDFKMRLESEATMRMPFVFMPGGG
ncbi:MAG: AgmX/PglI C-terminal domain-containing protein [Bradymonadaceae bacterium]